MLISLVCLSTGHVHASNSHSSSSNSHKRLRQVPSQYLSGGSGGDAAADYIPAVTKTHSYRPATLREAATYHPSNSRTSGHRDSHTPAAAAASAASRRALQFTPSFASISTYTPVFASNTSGASTATAPHQGPAAVAHQQHHHRQLEQRQVAATMRGAASYRPVSASSRPSLAVRGRAAGHVAAAGVARANSYVPALARAVDVVVQ